MPVDTAEIAARLAKARADRAPIEPVTGNGDDRACRGGTAMTGQRSMAGSRRGHAGAFGQASRPDQVDVPARGRGYVVFAIDGQLRVTDAACPHNGGPLAKGIVRDGSIICPWHWYRFDLQTGCCRTDAGYGLRLYPVIWRDGRAFVALPAAVRRRSWSWLLRALPVRAGTRNRPASQAPAAEALIPQLAALRRARPAL